MGLLKKQGVYGIDYSVSDRRKRERIGLDRCLAETGARSCCKGRDARGVHV